MPDSPKATFVAELPEPVRAEAEAEGSLGATLDELLRHARAAWPTVKPDDALFLQWLARRMPEGGSVVSTLRALNTDALYLTHACASGAPEALLAFERAFFGEIDPTLVRITHSRDLREDVAQRLRERLFLPNAAGKARVESYAGRGELRSWVRATVARIVLNLVAARTPEVAVEDAVLDALPAAGPDPELALVKQANREAFKAALRAAIGRLEPRERTILQHAFIDGLSIDEIGSIYGAHRATAARWIQKIREGVVEGVRAELRERLGQSEQAIRAFESSFELSIERYLTEGPTDQDARPLLT